MASFRQAVDKLVNKQQARNKQCEHILLTSVRTALLQVCCRFVTTCEEVRRTVHFTYIFIRFQRSINISCAQHRIVRDRNGLKWNTKHRFAFLFLGDKIMPRLKIATCAWLLVKCDIFRTVVVSKWYCDRVHIVELGIQSNSYNIISKGPVIIYEQHFERYCFAQLLKVVHCVSDRCSYIKTGHKFELFYSKFWVTKGLFIWSRLDGTGRFHPA